MILTIYISNSPCPFLYEINEKIFLKIRSNSLIMNNIGVISHSQLSVNECWDLTEHGLRQRMREFSSNPEGGSEKGHH